MDFTYCPFNLDYDDVTIDKIYSELLTIDNSDWHYNKFRGCYMLPVYNGGGQLGTGRIAQHDLSFLYTESIYEKCKTLITLCEDTIWPWMEPRGRVTILRTPPGIPLKPHLDSLENEIGTLQHKWRLVINGEIDKLYFIDANYNLTYVPDTNRCYVLDGSHPHALKEGKTEKMTLCIGSPWHGEPNEKYHSLLDYKNSLLVTRPDVLKEEWTDPFWKKY